MHNKTFLKKIILLFFFGMFSTYSLEPYKVYPLIICFSAAIFFVLETTKLWHTFLFGFSFSFGWFLSGLYWIGNSFLIKSGIFLILMPVAIIILPIFLSIFWATAFFISKYISHKFGEVHLNFVILFSILEFFRGNFLNFPWLMPGNFFSSNNYSLQAFSYLGSFSMNFILLVILILPIIVYKYKKQSLLLLLIIIFPLSYLFVKSYLRYEDKYLNFHDLHQIILIQPNIKQKVKWKKSLKKYHHQLLAELLKQNDGNKTNEFKTKLIIWPETAFLGLFPRDKDIIIKISQSFLAREKNEYLFTGLISRSKKHYFNSGILLDSKGEIKSIYNKNVLVPFGEYLPFKYLIPNFKFLQNKIDFSKGKRNIPVSINNDYEFLPLICYEIIFSKLISKSINSKTSLLLNITNDAWFGSTIGPTQHFQFAKIRAVEFGLPVVRVANTGISGVIGPYGNILKKINIDEKGILSEKLVKKLENTIFKTYGNKIIILLIILLITVNIIFSYKIKKG